MEMKKEYSIELLIAFNKEMVNATDFIQNRYKVTRYR